MPPSSKKGPKAPSASSPPRKKQTTKAKPSSKSPKSIDDNFEAEHAASLLAEVMGGTQRYGNMDGAVPPDSSVTSDGVLPPAVADELQTSEPVAIDALPKTLATVEPAASLPTAPVPGTTALPAVPSAPFAQLEAVRPLFIVKHSICVA